MAINDTFSFVQHCAITAIGSEWESTACTSRGPDGLQ